MLDGIVPKDDTIRVFPKGLERPGHFYFLFFLNSPNNRIKNILHLLFVCISRKQ